MLKSIKVMMTKMKLKKISREIGRKYQESVEFQRNGKLKEYAQSLAEVKVLEEEYALINAGLKQDAGK